MREFNVGYDCGTESPLFTQRLSNQLLTRVARAGASLRVTLYPERLAQPSSADRRELRRPESLPLRGSGSEPAVVVAYDPAWPTLFSDVGRRLRAELGAVAVRIDHIGSTAVPGLAAKPVIDVQISVEDLEPVDAYRDALRRAGFTWRSHNPDRMKRYFRELPGARRTHLHVRRAGSFSEQIALVFRDYLRSDPVWAARYGDEKLRLAYVHRSNRTAYLEAKEPIVWETLRRANHWAQRTGWSADRSDA